MGLKMTIVDGEDYFDYECFEIFPIGLYKDLQKVFMQLGFSVVNSLCVFYTKVYYSYTVEVILSKRKDTSFSQYTMRYQKADETRNWKHLIHDKRYIDMKKFKEDLRTVLVEIRMLS